MCKIFDYLNKYKEKNICYVIIKCFNMFSSVKLHTISYTTTQVGWWNYYGWQISEGKIVI